MKAIKYEVPVVDDVLPPPEETSPAMLPTPTTSTRQHPKPTEHLPTDHGVATGENSKPAFIASTTLADTQASPTGSSPPLSEAPDLGWFSDMSSLVTGQKWFFVALGAVSIFGVAVGIFFWRRRVAMRSGNYTSLNNENDVGMTALGTSISGGPRTTRELYDAFGEVSDDDDETTALRPQQARSTGGLGFHSGFLDDDDPSTAAGLTPQYRDEPENEDGQAHSKRQESTQEEGTASPTGSGDGSWEHASRD